MDSWWSIENDDMVPTWLFGENSRTTPVNPNAEDNMMPTWLRDKNEHERRKSLGSKKEKDSAAWDVGTSRVAVRRTADDPDGKKARAEAEKEKKKSTDSSNPGTSTQNSFDAGNEARIKGDDIVETKDGRIPAFTVYTYPHSFYTQKVLMTLYEKDIPFVEEMVNINLGDQFRDEFLIMNPKAEVPVLKDRENGTVVVDSELITLYLEEYYTQMYPRTRKVLPEVSSWRLVHDEFQYKINSLKIDSLTYGSVMFDQTALQIMPNYPYNYEQSRAQMREDVLNRATILRSQAARIRDTLPDVSGVLMRKFQQFEMERPLIEEPQLYEELILEFERVLDECEAQLQAQFERDPKFWLVCPFISQADISLAILLFRLWQLGFESRMWSKTTRPQINRYFGRMRKVRSFQKSTLMDPPRSLWPYVLGAVGCALIFALESVLRKSS